MTITVSSGEREEPLRTAEKMTQLVTLIQEYPAEAQLIMAAIEDGLTLGPAQLMDAVQRPEATPDAEAGATAVDARSSRTASGEDLVGRPSPTPGRSARAGQAGAE
jgi:hypothetical protein